MDSLGNRGFRRYPKTVTSESRRFPSIRAACISDHAHDEAITRGVHWILIVVRVISLLQASESPSYSDWLSLYSKEPISRKGALRRDHPIWRCTGVVPNSSRKSSNDEAFQDRIKGFTFTRLKWIDMIHSGVFNVLQGDVLSSNPNGRQWRRHLKTRRAKECK